MKQIKKSMVILLAVLFYPGLIFGLEVLTIWVRVKNSAIMSHGLQPARKSKSAE